MPRADKTQRYGLLDSVRGICMIGLVVYHALFDCIYMFDMFDYKLTSSAFVYIRDLGCVLFVLLAGICEHFGKHKVKRALLLLLCGGVISLISQIFLPDANILFGVLTFMGAAGFLMLLPARYLRRIPPGVGFSSSFAAFLLFYNIPYGTLGVYALSVCELPSFLYRNLFTAALGFPPESFSSADYFPLFPWIFLYLAGFFLWSLLEKKETVLRILRIRIPVLEAIGRYSLWIYLAHQPLLYGIFWLLRRL